MDDDARWDQRVHAFGRRVAALRRDRGWSQEHLADIAGLHRTYIGQLESGRRNVALRNLYRLSDALNVDVSDLLESS